MSKSVFTFIFEGIAQSGAGVGPSPITKVATSAAEARKAAKLTFESTRGAKVTSCKNVTKKK